MYQEYLNYSSEDFTTDPFFKEWVLSPTSRSEQYWKGFLTSYPHKAAHIYEAKILVLAINTHFDKAEISSNQKNQYFDQVLQDAELAQQRPSPASRSVFLHKWAIAASALLIVFMVIFIWRHYQPQYEVYQTQYGEWKTFILPDGSDVKLNANSEIRFASNWDEDEDRRVWLKGEAYFEVEKKPATEGKFVVISGDVSVEVLGTRFNVYQRGDQTEVFLEEGKIKLAAQEEEKFMETGDLITYSAKEKRMIDVQRPEDHAPGSWKDGTLILKDATINRSIREMEEIYGVKFKIENQSLLNRKATLRIPMDRLEIALPVVAKTWGVEIIEEGNYLIIKELK